MTASPPRTDIRRHA
jgi:hypothetical protein